MDLDSAGVTVGSTEPLGGRRSMPRTLIVLLLLVAAGAGTWYLGIREGSRPAAAPSPVPAAIPVVVEQVQQRDFPVRLSGLGTVTAFNTVLVRPRVDGRIESIEFDEGQDVKPGDVLA